MQSSRSTESSIRPLVLSIHGIRTTGQWQDDLAEALDRAGFRHRPLNFGFFRAASLLLPWARQGKVDWFLKEIERKVDDDGVPPSIIAHSFGTYILTKALEKQSLLRFDRIVLCGSIVRRDYPWSTIVQGGQVNCVLNEAGGKDLWCGLVGWVVSDAGPSGVDGFHDAADGRILELRHELHRHSDYFSDLNYRKRWIPFLKGITPESPPKRPLSKLNLRFAAFVTAFIFVSALGALVWIKNATNEHEQKQIQGLSDITTPPSTVNTKPNRTVTLPVQEDKTLIPAQGGAQRLRSDQAALNNPPTSTQATVRTPQKPFKAIQRTVPTDENRVDQPKQHVPKSASVSGASSTGTGISTPTTSAPPVAIVPAENTWQEKCYEMCESEGVCLSEKRASKSAVEWQDKWLALLGTEKHDAADFARQTMEKYEQREKDYGVECQERCDKKCNR